jgi:hypothetical protein
MYYDPHTHLAIARARHEDMLREARKRELARSVAVERPGLIARLSGLLRERRGAKQPVVRPA